MDWSTLIRVLPWIVIGTFFYKSWNSRSESATSRRLLGTDEGSEIATWRFLGVDEWSEITKYLDGVSIARLSCTSRWFRMLLGSPATWRVIFLREFDLPDPGEVETHWKTIYASALQPTTLRRHPFRPTILMQPRGYSRIGAILLDSPIAMLFKSTVVKDMFIHVRDVKKGIWIIDLKVSLVRFDHDNRDRYFRVLEGRHAEVELPDAEEHWSWDVFGKHVVLRPTSYSVLSIYDQQHFDRSNARDLVQSEALWSACEGMSAKKLKTVHGASARIRVANYAQHNNTFLSCMVRRSEDGKAIGLRILELLS